MPSQNECSDDEASNDTGLRTAVTEPRALRAVAHPVRIELLALLRANGPLTASRCSERLGLTAKVCSYHLQVLGKYGLIEETGQGKGRQRPWRLAASGLTYVHHPGLDRGAAEASDQLARTVLARDARIVGEFIAGRHGLPLQWRNVSTLLGDELRLTPGQLGSMTGELAEVLERYAQLSSQASAGTRTVHVALYAVPAELAA
jgi:DNA-binding transcriptional ArsR family regulator